MTDQEKFSAHYLPLLRQGERIETTGAVVTLSGLLNLPLLRQGERIETLLLEVVLITLAISPCFGRGSGLKRYEVARSLESSIVEDLPLLRQGERIETIGLPFITWKK